MLAEDRIVGGMLVIEGGGKINHYGVVGVGGG